MNTTALFDLLAARAAQQENTAAVEMLNRLRDQSGTDSAQSTQELLAQLAQNNPTLGVLAQHMAEQRAAAARNRATVIDAEIVETDEEHREIMSAARRLEEESAELRGRMQALAAEIGSLRERMELVADALGACGLCWGQDPQCRACRGRGRPGYALPDEELFADLVLPAVQMMRACKIKNGVIAPMTSVTSIAPGASTSLRHT